MVYLSIVNKIKSSIINKYVWDRWRVSEIGDECPIYGNECPIYGGECPWYDDEYPNSMTTNVITITFNHIKYLVNEINLYVLISDKIMLNYIIIFNKYNYLLYLLKLQTSFNIP